MIQLAGDALISPCGQYRHWLYRRLACVGEYRPVVFVMLNPSRADKVKPDPTITRCKGFGQGFGATALIVVNIFDARTPYPTDLRKHPKPLSPFNDTYVEAALEHATVNDGIIIAAWGRNAETVMGRRRVEALAPLFKRYKMQALAFTKKGTPGHPLMLPSASTLQPWAA